MSQMHLAMTMGTRGGRPQTWRTPSDLFDALNREFSFTLDGASDGENSLLPRSRTPDDLFYTWEGERVFCNPPWANVLPFVELAATAELAVLLVPARTNCGWFHRALDLGAQVRFFRGRPNFGGVKGQGSPYDCVLLIFGGESGI